MYVIVIATTMKERPIPIPIPFSVTTSLVGHKLARGNKHAKLEEAGTQVTFA